MNNFRFERAARRRRSKALLLTVFFHLLLLGGIAYSSGEKLLDILPDKIQQFIGMDPAAEEAAEEAVRP